MALRRRKRVRAVEMHRRSMRRSCSALGNVGRFPHKVAAHRLSSYLPDDPAGDLRRVDDIFARCTRSLTRVIDLDSRLSTLDSISMSRTNRLITISTILDQVLLLGSFLSKVQFARGVKKYRFALRPAERKKNRSSRVDSFKLLLLSPFFCFWSVLRSS